MFTVLHTSYAVFLIIFQFGGAELPEATAHEIDLLMEQQDQFNLEGKIFREMDELIDIHLNRN